MSNTTKRQSNTKKSGKAVPKKSTAKTTKSSAKKGTKRPVSQTRKSAGTARPATKRTLNHREQKRLTELKRRRNRWLISVVLIAAAVILGGILLIRFLMTALAGKSTASTLTVKSNGQIRLEEVEDIQVLDVDAAELKSYVKDAIKTFNQESNSGKAKAVRFGTVGDNAYVETSYEDAETYSDFSGYTLFTGSIEDAQKAGYTFADAFVQVTGEAKGEYVDASEVLSDLSKNVVIIEENIRVKVRGDVTYVTDGSTSVLSKDTIGIFQADGNSDATELVYIIYE